MNSVQRAGTSERKACNGYTKTESGSSSSTLIVVIIVIIFHTVRAENIPHRINSDTSSFECVKKTRAVNILLNGQKSNKNADTGSQERKYFFTNIIISPRCIGMLYRRYFLSSFNGPLGTQLSQNVRDRSSPNFLTWCACSHNRKTCYADSL